MDSRMILVAVFCCFAVLCIRAEYQDQVYAEQRLQNKQQSLGATELASAAAVDNDGSNLPHERSKRTLFFKKKLILGAGILGFGLGVAKGYKAGYSRRPEVHHVYVAPPVRYVEYAEKPVYVERIVEKPVFHSAPEYEWSPSDHSSSYGSW